MNIPEGWKLVPVEATEEMMFRAEMQQPRNYRDLYEAMLDAAPTPPEQHSDDVAVDRFAAAMKAKLARKRAEGRGGWDDPEQCPVERLAELLHEHVSKGDPIDVANFAMMLWCRGGRTTPPAQDDECAPDPWHAAIDNELVCCHILNESNHNDPRKALQDIINWHVQVALDPAVSSEAQKLIEQGRKQNDEALEALRTLVDTADEASEYTRCTAWSPSMYDDLTQALDKARALLAKRGEA